MADAHATTMMPLLFAGAHMIGDFVTQTPYMAAHKLSDWRVRAWHVTVYTMGFVPVVMLTDWSFVRCAMFGAVIWLTHFITDCRRWASPDPWPPKPIMVDQSIHVVTLAVLGVAFGL